LRIISCATPVSNRGPGVETQVHGGEKAEAEEEADAEGDCAGSRHRPHKDVADGERDGLPEGEELTLEDGQVGAGDPLAGVLVLSVAVHVLVVEPLGLVLVSAEAVGDALLLADAELVHVGGCCRVAGREKTGAEEKAGTAFILSPCRPPCRVRNCAAPPAEVPATEVGRKQLGTALA
jgi:hypothetical protein